MQLRYPGGLPLDDRRRADAARQSVALVLGGNITIRDGVYTKRFEPNVDIFALASGGTGLPARRVGDGHAAGPVRRQDPGAGDAAAGEQPRADRLARRPDAQRHLRSIRSSSAAPTSSAARSSSRATATAITRGTIDFLNPARIQPFFDLEAETPHPRPRRSAEQRTPAAPTPTASPSACRARSTGG